MNTTASSDWAKKQAHAILDEFTPLPEWEYDKRHEILVKNLLAAAKVPEGCVRTADGVDRKVLGEFFYTEDGAIVADGARVYFPNERDSIIEWDVSGAGDHVPVGKYWSTREAAQAALAARVEVNREG